jgi:hypothetical protein
VMMRPGLTMRPIFVDEDAIIDLLENAPDYECGLEQLESGQKTVVDRLRRRSHLVTRPCLLP